MNKVNKVIFDLNELVEPCYQAQTEAFGSFDFKFLKNLVKEIGAKRILDIGCGEGDFTLEFAGKIKGPNLKAIDANSTLITKAQSKNQPRKTNVSFANITFDDNFSESADLVYSRFAVEHMKSPENFLNSAHRCLRPKGCLAIIEYFVEAGNTGDKHWKSFREKELELYSSIGSDPQVESWLPEKMKSSGFKDVKSSRHEISPSTIPKHLFYNLVDKYAKLYHCINSEIWDQKFVEDIINWCTSHKDSDGFTPSMILTHTQGKKL